MRVGARSLRADELIPIIRPLQKVNREEKNRLRESMFGSCCIQTPEQSSRIVLQGRPFSFHYSTDLMNGPGLVGWLRPPRLEAHSPVPNCEGRGALGWVVFDWDRRHLP
jgi:hypothetical protein